MGLDYAPSELFVPWNIDLAAEKDESLFLGPVVVPDLPGVGADRFECRGDCRVHVVCLPNVLQDGLLGAVESDMAAAEGIDAEPLRFEEGDPVVVVLAVSVV